MLAGADSIPWLHIAYLFSPLLWLAVISLGRRWQARKLRLEAARPIAVEMVKVSVTNLGVMCDYATRGYARIRWDAMTGVLVRTTDPGPRSMNAPLKLWLLYAGPLDTNQFFVVPWGCVGENKLAERLQVLPGFDCEQFDEARFCLDEQLFCCWVRPPAPTTP